MMRHLRACAFIALLAISLLTLSASAQELRPGTKVFVICPGGGSAQLVDEDDSVQIEHGMLYRIEESAPNCLITELSWSYSANKGSAPSMQANIGGID